MKSWLTRRRNTTNACTGRNIAIALIVGMIMGGAYHESHVVAPSVVSDANMPAMMRQVSMLDQGRTLQAEYAQNLTGVVRQLMDRVARLEHACVPVDTGGGVTQCTQPSLNDVRQNALLFRVCSLKVWEDASGAFESRDGVRYVCVRRIDHMMGGR